MAAHFGRGSRSRAAIGDDDVLNLLQDGNLSDIEDLEDEGDQFDPTLFNSLLDEEDQNLPPENVTSSSQARPSGSEPPPEQQAQASHHEVIIENTLSRRNTMWRQSAFTDKDHHYPRSPWGPVMDEVDYVHHYFDDDFFEMAARCTNIYHLRKHGKELKTTSSEIKKLFAIHLLMGVITYPRVPMYWAGNTRLPLIADRMSRDRFLQLRNSLHVVDSETQPENTPPNPLWKVQPMIDQVQAACYRLERVPGYYSVDEQMIPFTGRCVLRQVVRNKPRPTGLKNFVATTSEGLMIDFEIYKGAKTMFGNSNLGVGPSVVLYLTKTIPPESCIYHDRYFTTVPLIEEMGRRQLHSTGTIMINRIPGRTALKFKKDSKMIRGEHQQFVRDSVSLVKWKDNKAVLMASNCTGAAKLDYVKRWDKPTKAYKDVSIPKVVSNYNQHMGGVDVLDQMMEYYRAFIKTKKWTLKVLVHFLDLAVVNAWRKYKIDCEGNRRPRKNTLPLLDFKMNVADAWLESPGQRRRLTVEPPNEDVRGEEAPPEKKRYLPPKPTNAKRYDGYDHLPISDQLMTPRTCRLETCSSRSKIRCTKCDVYLCLSRDKKCYSSYHTKPDN